MLRICLRRAHLQIVSVFTPSLSANCLTVSLADTFSPWFGFHSKCHRRSTHQRTNALTTGEVTAIRILRATQEKVVTMFSAVFNAVKSALKSPLMMNCRAVQKQVCLSNLSHLNLRNKTANRFLDPSLPTLLLPSTHIADPTSDPELEQQPGSVEEGQSRRRSVGADAWRDDRQGRPKFTDANQRRFVTLLSVPGTRHTSY